MTSMRKLNRRLLRQRRYAAKTRHTWPWPGVGYTRGHRRAAEEVEHMYGIRRRRGAR